MTFQHTSLIPDIVLKWFVFYIYLFKNNSQVQLKISILFRKKACVIMNISNYTIPDFDSNSFKELSLCFGIPELCLLSFWIVINHIFMVWQPARFSVTVIAKTIKKNSSHFLVILLTILYWVFFSSPFILNMIFGLITCLKIKPIAAGIFVLIVPNSIIIFFFALMNYTKRGYKFGKTDYL